MLLLSTIVGRAVLGERETIVGRLTDCIVTMDDTGRAPHLAALVVRRARGGPMVVPWQNVTSFPHTVQAIAFDGAAQSMPKPLGTNELLIRQDVLDTQVIDIAGQRLARVADVVIARRPTGHFEMVGVEVGFGAVMRRLGFQRLATRMPVDAVSWRDLHPISQRAHAVQLATSRSAIHLLNARDLAVLLTKLDVQSATEVLAARGPDVAAEVIHASHPELGERVLRAMPAAAAADVVAAMPAQHAQHWRRILTRAPDFRARRYLRSHTWPRRRHTPPGPLR
jgi:hypothetical protein